MKDYILQRKIARVIAIIAERMGITQQRALEEFYQSPVCRWMHDAETQLQTMSDQYVADEFFLCKQNKQKP